MTPRGTRPTQPRSWGREAEGIRTEAEQTGREIVSLAEQIQNTTNAYDHKAMVSEIKALGERITRLMIQAKVGG